MCSQRSKDKSTATLLRALAACCALSAALTPAPALSEDSFVVYSIYRALNMGGANETPQKDYYVNMGSRQGLHEGAKLSVYRKVSTYDLTNQKLYADITFPIATLKVIHVQGNAAVARLDKILPTETTPVSTPKAVMVGDQVRVSTD